MRVRHPASTSARGGADCAARPLRGVSGGGLNVSKARKPRNKLGQVLRGFRASVRLVRISPLSKSVSKSQVYILAGKSSIYGVTILLTPILAGIRVAYDVSLDSAGRRAHKRLASSLAPSTAF